MMNNKYLLTVIIPVYNTEKYIKRCIDSILNQSFKYIKIIIINDNSTDRSSSIIHKFSSYEQVKIIENSYNIGQGESRNIGLNLVDTDYFCFLDSDDWVDTQAYETAVKALEEKPICDIAIFGIKTEYENSSCSTLRYDYNNNIIDGDFAINLLSRETSQDTPISALIGNKVFRNSSFDKTIKFSNLTYEDTIFSYKALSKCKKVILLPKTYLHYYQRESSIMHSFSYKYIDDLIDNFVDLKDYLCEISSFNTKQYYSYFDKCCSSMLNSMLISTQNASEQKEYINHLCSQVISRMSIKDLINYLDINRIRKLLY